MRPTLFVAALLLGACGSAPAESGCHAYGLALVGDVPAVDSMEPGSDGFSCASLERAVGVILGAFDRSPDPRLAQLDNLEGWTVEIHPSTGWHISPAPHLGESVNGLAYCQDKRIVISDVPFLDGELAHEMAHAGQACAARGPADPSDPMHSNWERDVVPSLLAVQAAEGELYWDNPHCYQTGHYIGPTDGGSCEAAP